MSFIVQNTPIFTLIEDNGRFGFEDIGVTQSGVMDRISYKQLNMLLSNFDDTPCLEILFGNITLKATKNTILATTGAKCEVFVNNIAKSNYETISIKKNDIVKIGKILEGSRVYLGVKGGFNIKKDFNSCSTTIKEGLGGINRDKLKQNDILEFDEYNKVFHKRLKDEYKTKFMDTIILNVLLSYQHHTFNKEEKEKFFSSEFVITNDFNRMACKLDGVSINSDLKGIISEGICMGAIQIPPNGKPIILLNERQTIGGYPKIGSVIPTDCDKLSQAKPNTKVRFNEITLDKAREKELKFINSFSN